MQHDCNNVIIRETDKKPDERPEWVTCGEARIKWFQWKVAWKMSRTGEMGKNADRFSDTEIYKKQM